jgi:hypothetical protein
MEARIRALENDVMRLKKTIVWQRYEMERMRRVAGIPEPLTRDERIAEIAENVDAPRPTGKAAPGATTNGGDKGVSNANGKHK